MTKYYTGRYHEIDVTNTYYFYNCVLYTLYSCRNRTGFCPAVQRAEFGRLGKCKLRAGNLDGYLSPDPFNQRAVWEKVGFLHTLTKDIWDGHPCCAFACSEKFTTELPNTYGALLKALVDATAFSSKAENRAEISKAIAPKNYLNQPEAVIAQVLTGKYADGLGNVLNDPKRIDFDPFPWHSMGVWILTQMKRWGYISGDLDYKGIAEEVYLASDATRAMGQPSR